MSSTRPLSAELRGGAVGALTAAMAVAAHGTAGGDVPSSAALVLLLALSVAVGVMASTLGRAPVWWLVGGQVTAHGVLSVADVHGGHAMSITAPMLVAHAVAIGACAAVLGAAERLYGPITSVVRAPLLSPPAPPATVSISMPHKAVRRPAPAPFRAVLTSRGPPSVLAH